MKCDDRVIDRSIVATRKGRGKQQACGILCWPLITQSNIKQEKNNLEFLKTLVILSK